MTATDNEDTTIATETGLGRFQVEARAGQNAILIDEPVAFGGLGTGMNPYNILSAALGACKTMTMRLYANNKGWKIDHIAVSVRHSRPSLQARDVFHAEIMVKGDLDEVQRARLAEIADRCPVHMTLSRGADVQTRLLPPQAAFDQELPVNTSHEACMEEACD